MKESQNKEFDFDSAYRVEGYGGVAWRAIGYVKEWTEESWTFFGNAGDDRDDKSNYLYNEPEEIEDRTKVRCIMVGDDREFTFDIEELSPLDEEEFCPACGQIGCGWH